MREGRRTHANTMKYIRVTTSSNFGNVLSVLVAGVALPFLPMSALQLLFLGLASDLSLAAMPWDRVGEETLGTPRRWDTDAVIRSMLCLGLVSSVLDILTFLVLWAFVCPAVAGGPWVALGDPVARAAFAAAFQTGWFIESMWTQTVVVHMLRESRPLGVPPVAALVASTLAAVAAVTALPWVPVLGAALDLVLLPVPFLAVTAVLTLLCLGLAYLAKRLVARRPTA